MPRVALIHKHFRSNHLDQARMVAALPGVEAHFIELAGREASNPWEQFPQRLPNLRTLTETPIERAPQGRLCTAVWQALDDVDPEVVVIAGYNARPLRAAARWARAHGRRCVLILDAVEHGKYRWPFLEYAKARFVGAHFHAAFVGGRHGRDYAIKLGLPAEQVWTGYQALDNAYYAGQADAAHARAEALQQELGLEAPCFLFAGRLHHHKNPFRLLLAYARYRRQHPQGWGLLMVGDGPMGPALRWYGRAAKIPGVRWLGIRRPEEMPAFYQLAGAVILPSVAETWGPVVNEGMACGLPVLVSERCGCAPELAQPGRNGAVFNPYDLKAMAQAMAWMAARTPEERDALGRASREIIAGFTLERWATNFAAAIGLDTVLPAACGSILPEAHVTHRLLA